MNEKFQSNFYGFFQSGKITEKRVFEIIKNFQRKQLDNEEMFRRTRELPSSTKYTICANLLRHNLQRQIQLDIEKMALTDAKAVTYANALGVCGGRAKKITKSNQSYNAWLLTHCR